MNETQGNSSEQTRSVLEVLSDVEKLKFYREEVRHELSLLGMRSTMLVFCQSFLVVPFAILNTAASFRAVLAAEYLIAALGILLALLLSEPLSAARRTMDKWLLKQRELQRRSPVARELAIDRDLIPGVELDLKNDREHFRSLAFWWYAPMVSMGFWVLAAAFCTGRVWVGV